MVEDWGVGLMEPTPGISPNISLWPPEVGGAGHSRTVVHHVPLCCCGMVGFFLAKFLVSLTSLMGLAADC
eukprot:2769633-Pyramimonas_sp.AAC.4